MIRPTGIVPVPVVIKFLDGRAWLLVSITANGDNVWIIAEARDDHGVTFRTIWIPNYNVTVLRGVLPTALINLVIAIVHDVVIEVLVFRVVIIVVDVAVILTTGITDGLGYGARTVGGTITAIPRTPL